MRRILLASATASPKRTPTSETEGSQHFVEMPMAISVWTVASDHLEIKYYEFASCSKGSQLRRARKLARILQKTIRLRKRYSTLETASSTKSSTTSFIERRVISSIKVFDASAEGCYSHMRTTSRLRLTSSPWKTKIQKHLLATAPLQMPLLYLYASSSPTPTGKTYKDAPRYRPHSAKPSQLAQSTLC